MYLGKVGHDVLKNIFRKLNNEFILDSNILKWNYGEDLIISTNPALGVPLETLGFFAFHYSVSNIVVSMGKPVYIIDSIILPPNTNEDIIEKILEGIQTECKKYDVKIIGGHTGFYYGVEIPVINVTAIGVKIREARRPKIGDCLVLMGEYGEESLWLGSLNGLVNEKYLDIWRNLTPIPKALFALSRDEVKVMHDVSEGGLARGLLDIVEKFGLGIKADIKHLRINKDLLRMVKINELYSIPNFGLLILVVEKSSCERFIDECREKGFNCHILGTFVNDRRLIIDDVVIEKVSRTSFDYLYGYIDSLDPIVNTLNRVLKELENHREITNLIPEVGLNMVYGKKTIGSVRDIAGLSGRVIKSLGRPKICGRVVYGGSRHLALVLYKAHKFDRDVRAGVNIRGDEHIFEKLKDMGLSIKRIKGYEEAICPIADFIEKEHNVYNAYYHVGGFGVEPSIVILGKNPEELLNIMVKVSKYV